MTCPVIIVQQPHEMEQALHIRHRVFVEEQNVPPSLEVDEWDEKATHFLAYADGQPAGTGRVRWVRPGILKVERVAVLKERRGSGIGQALMTAMEDYARQRKAARIILHAQVQAQPFYRKLGYVPEGDIFLDADIEHIQMVKPLNPRTQ